MTQRRVGLQLAIALVLVLGGFAGGLGDLRPGLAAASESQLVTTKDHSHADHDHGLEIGSRPEKAPHSHPPDLTVNPNPPVFDDPIDPLCVTDELTERHVYVIYVEASSPQWTYAEMKPLILDHVDKANNVFNQEAKDVGAEWAQFRFKCDPGGGIHVSDGHPQAGYDNPMAQYWRIKESGTPGAQPCIPDDPPYGQTNGCNDQGGLIATTIAQGGPSGIFRNGGSAYDHLLHESGHTMGAVNKGEWEGAPGADGGHCWDGPSSMCISGEPPDFGHNRWWDGSICKAQAEAQDYKLYDCHKDDWFNPCPPPPPAVSTDPDPFKYIRTYWNVGAEYNLWIDRGPCQALDPVPENRPECADEVDNDVPPDGFTDYTNDPGCTSLYDDDESDDPECSDGIDNDGDGRIDLWDPVTGQGDGGCSAPWDQREKYQSHKGGPWLFAPACADGIDNESVGDGRIDFGPVWGTNDGGCLHQSQNLENGWYGQGDPQCGDGIDNDDDDLIDEADDGCDDMWDTSEVLMRCQNGTDDDWDGWTDAWGLGGEWQYWRAVDPQCTLSSQSAGAPTQHWEEKPECSDGIDNDDDGLIDFNDSADCTQQGDRLEDTSLGECWDGIDNDGDGRVDFSRDMPFYGPYGLNYHSWAADYGCTSETDTSERYGQLLNPQCTDGIDNDSDGVTDFDPHGVNHWGYVDSGDPGCADPYDNRESSGGSLGLTGSQRSGPVSFI